MDKNKSDIYRVNAEADKIALEYSNSRNETERVRLAEIFFDMQRIKSVYRKARSKLYNDDFDEFSSRYAEELMKLIDSYDADKSDSFTAYYYLNISRRIIDSVNRSYSRIKDEISLEDRAGETEETALKDVLSAPDRYSAENVIVCDAASFMYLAVMNALMAKKLTGSKRDKKDYNISSKFFSETTVSLAKEEYLESCEVKRHESTAFSVMDNMFLDHILTDECRSIAKIKVTPCRYRMPLKDAVYVEYMENREEKVNKSTISRKRHEYRNMMREYLK